MIRDWLLHGSLLLAGRALLMLNSLLTLGHGITTPTLYAGNIGEIQQIKERHRF